jgi:hypothetical protein
MALPKLDEIKLPGSLENGTYTVVCEEAEEKLTKNGEAIKCVFKVEEHGNKIYHYFNTVNSNAVAQRIGLGQLKQFIEFSDLANKTPTEAMELCGARCLVKIKSEEDNMGVVRPKIQSFLKK